MLFVVVLNCWTQSSFLLATARKWSPYMDTSSMSAMSPLSRLWSRVYCSLVVFSRYIWSLSAQSKWSEVGEYLARDTISGLEVCMCWYCSSWLSVMPSNIQWKRNCHATTITKMINIEAKLIFKIFLLVVFIKKILTFVINSPKCALNVNKVETVRTQLAKTKALKSWKKSCVINVDMICCKIE